LKYSVCRERQEKDETLLREYQSLEKKVNEQTTYSPIHLAHGSKDLGCWSDEGKFKVGFDLQEACK
jgi:hypothetical protein